ncbi:hypothetical protein ruthe_00746 [Rubellimicrobium thermophilum DSM 16684]|uniref:Uncharacterized protein n=1 Tax=Rubellimicrobium thermophilum DSM 16684 TaxID=1123069 RepID=S9R616_9RHOB|nr:hypothetical protein ruthe_00746 [Rubellimicrobium thermophilum DSM 16684]
MAVLHLAGRGGRIGDARDMDDAGMVGEDRPAAGQVMMEGVMHEAEAPRGIQGFDRLDRLRLEAQRAALEAERLDEADQAVILQHRPQRPQRQTQTGLPFAIAHSAAVIAGDERDALGPRGAGDPHEGQGLGLAPGRPVVEALDLGQGQKAQTAFADLFSGGLGGQAVEERPRQVVPQLHPRHAQAGRQIEQRAAGQPGGQSCG